MKNKKKLLSWLDDIMPIRNYVEHSNTLNRECRKRLKEIHKYFEKIYNNWEKESFRHREERY